jgi:putative addiction module component (TIGR02574 family)
VLSTPSQPSKFSGTQADLPSEAGTAPSFSSAASNTSSTVSTGTNLSFCFASSGHRQDLFWPLGVCLPHRIDRNHPNRYLFGMSTQQLTTEAMALPLPERVSLAQALWQSIDAGLADTDEREAVREAIRRDQELSSGAVTGRTRREVMQAARRAIGCD